LVLEMLKKFCKLFCPSRDKIERKTKLKINFFIALIYPSSRFQFYGA